ncbi:MAG: MBL fold metallo-hydrolase [Alphaproteobacteria bacterium]|nr:MBL fold metallo-hydrolase [Alphaproteobacteria bacterium]
MTLNIESFFDEATFTASHLVWDAVTREAAVIDTVLDLDARSGKVCATSADKILSAIRSHDLALAYVLETHAHADHLSAAQTIKAHTGAKIVIGAAIEGVSAFFTPLLNLPPTSVGELGFDRLVRDGDILPLGEHRVAVIATPGHTPACVTYRIGDALFVGDTLFMPDYGTARCDFPGGDATQLYRSIRRLLNFPLETRMFLCHDYKAPGRDEFRFETTVGAQREGNIHARDGISEADFVAMRQARDATLVTPALLYPSLQVNVRAGRLPPAEANGRRYLKIPLTIGAGVTA